jgi:hypothetical protein
MKQKTFSSLAPFIQLLSITAGAWIAFAGAVRAQTNAALGTNAFDAIPAQVTDITQIPGATIKKTGNVITDLSIKDCKALTEADYKLIRQTETLKNVSFNLGFNDAALKILAGMPAIEAFGTNGAGLTDAGVATLATFKNLQSLTFFHPGGGFTGTGLAALAVLPNLNNLTVAGSPNLTDAGLAAIAQLSHLKAFRTWHGNVTVDGLKALGALKELNNLTIGQRLAMKPPSTVNDDAIAVLATFSSLESLSVAEARLTLPALSKLSQLPNLKTLTLNGIDIPQSDIAALQQQMPKTKIIWTAPTDMKRINGMFGPAGASTAAADTTRAASTTQPPDAKSGN